LFSLLAGIFLSILLSLSLSFLNIWLNGWSWLIFFLLFLFSIIFGFNIDQFLKHWYRIRRRKRVLRIGILNDMGWESQNEEIKTYTNICPQAWKKELEELGKGKKIDVKLITCKEPLESYTVVINPYGEVYPEYELGELGTLRKILEYVRGGGLFVNIAGIPCYYAFSPLLKKRVDLAFRDSPYTYERVSTNKGDLFIPAFKYPLFDSTPLAKELDLIIRGTEETPAFNWDLRPSENFKEIFPEIRGIKVHRVAIVEKNVKPVVEPRVYVNGPGIRKGSSTPIFYLPYGNGGFLISLIFIDQHPEDVQNKLKQAICKLILSYRQYAPKIQ